jgi:hypothetical protein
MKKVALSVCCLLVVVFAASGLWSTKAVQPQTEDQIIEAGPSGMAAYLTFEEMTRQSEVILTGNCIDTRSEWIENNRVLVTVATISGGEVIKGGSSSTVEVVLPGGVDVNRRIPVAMTYAGAPQIARDEEVFLFLTSEEAVPGSYVVTGFAQGKFSIVEGEDGEKLVARDPSRVRLQNKAGVVRGNRQAIGLSEFKQKVRDLTGN